MGRIGVLVQTLEDDGFCFEAGDPGLRGEV